jgi:uncharacterized protein (DUF2267 family)
MAGPIGVGFDLAQHWVSGLGGTLYAAQPCPRMEALRAMTTIRDFNAAIHTTDEWIDDLMRRLSWHDRERVYLAFLAVLHALRDALPRDEAVYVGAQMPALLRGLYYEGWHPGARGPGKSRSAFLERIHDGVHRDPGIDAEEVARAVFALLAARMPAAELEDAKAATPKALHNLWPS